MPLLCPLSAVIGYPYFVFIFEMYGVVGGLGDGDEDDGGMFVGIAYLWLCFGMLGLFVADEGTDIPCFFVFFFYLYVYNLC